MTLLDYPGHVACTIFLSGCDFRCPFCHNSELLEQGTPRMTMDYVQLFLRARRKVLDGVAITGGEPCLQHDLPGFLAMIKREGYKVKLDTNGHHPKMLRMILTNALVDYIAMDIKGAPGNYGRLIGGRPFSLPDLDYSIKLIMNSGVDYEFRTTVVDELHSAEDFEEIGQWIRGAKRYFLQPFVDRESVPFEGFHAPSREKLKSYAHRAAEYVDEVRIRGADLGGF